MAVEFGKNIIGTLLGRKSSKFVEPTEADRRATKFDEALKSHNIPPLVMLKDVTGEDAMDGPRPFVLVFLDWERIENGSFRSEVPGDFEFLAGSNALRYSSGGFKSRVLVPALAFLIDKKQQIEDEERSSLIREGGKHIGGLVDKLNISVNDTIAPMLEIIQE